MSHILIVPSSEADASWSGRLGLKQTNSALLLCPFSSNPSAACSATPAAGAVTGCSVWTRMLPSPLPLASFVPLLFQRTQRMSFRCPANSRVRHCAK